VFRDSGSKKSAGIRELKNASSPTIPEPISFSHAAAASGANLKLGSELSLQRPGAPLERLDRARQLLVMALAGGKQEIRNERPEEEQAHCPSHELDDDREIANGLYGWNAVESEAYERVIEHLKIRGISREGELTCIKLENGQVQRPHGGDRDQEEPHVRQEREERGSLALPVAAQAQTAPTCFGREATVVGTSGSERLFGTDGVDVIVGLGGNDSSDALGANDFVCGGAGDDQGLGGGSGADQINGQSGSDELNGRNGPDRLINGEFMFGEGGNDYLRAPGTQRSVQIDGGPGTDTCVGDSDDFYTNCEVVRIR
jgi:hypothetical protein